MIDTKKMRVKYSTAYQYGKVELVTKRDVYALCRAVDELRTLVRYASSKAKFLNEVDDIHERLKQI